MKKIILVFILLPLLSQAQEGKWQGKFEQLDQILPTPNEYRTGSGTPGAKYWQQRADYTIDAEIDETTNVLKGKETIVYHNNSPENLKYLWLQLDQNVNKKESEDFASFYLPVRDSLTTVQMQRLTRAIEFPAGYTIESVKDGAANNLPVTINKTMMRIDLPAPLKSGEKYTLAIEWSYPITDRSQFLLSREGYEYFPEDKNAVYLIGHWFPRMCVFNDTEGWQNKQFQRLGEFALEFGDYKVNITVPADHVISSTGALQNAKEVLTGKELERFEKGKTAFDKPIFVVTPDEAKAKEKTKSTSKKTWTFHADNVRDFAFASSRKFIWDTQAVKLPTNTVLAMSFYPKEGLPVWQQESTLAIKNALEVYSKYSFDYPYPTANSVNTSNIGMEFPMISFNGGRPDKDGKMSDAAKEGMVGTIVHEVGHNWFPMIVSSDERQWMWMDEGLNTFLQTRTEMERYPHYNFTRPASIVPYMKGDKAQMRPVMVTSDHERLNAFGNNYYQKPTVALTILRETVIGPELFDKAFKEYSNAWKYKHPNPADLFRIIEEATATDLDWFWRGWFMTTDNVDMSVEEIKWFKLKSLQTDPENKNKTVKSGDLASGKTNTDFSSGPQEFTLTDTPEQLYGEFKSRVDDNSVRQKLQGKNIYEVKLKNRGGLVMPLIIEWTYKDGSKELEKIPAEVWRINEEEITKVFIKDKEVVNMVLDPKNDLADVDESNNTFPKNASGSQFDNFKKKSN